MYITKTNSSEKPGGGGAPKQILAVPEKLIE